MQRQRWGMVPAISFDEMWTYQRARRDKKRQEVWIWTAVIELPDGRRCVDFEVGDRSGETFLRLYERLPETERYYSDDYGVYGSWLPAERHIVGKGKLANRNEGLHSEYRGAVEAIGAGDDGVHEAGVGIAWFAGVAVFASAAGPKIQCQRVLKIPPASRVPTLGWPLATVGGSE